MATPHCDPPPHVPLGESPTISGHLGTIDVQDVMGFLGTLPRGGALEINSPDGELTLYLEGGVIVGGHVPRGGVDAAALLLSRGRLRTPDLDAVRGRSGAADLYSALAEAGHVREEEIEELVGEELSENLVRLFGWAPGEFRFFEGCSPPPQIRPVRIEIQSLLLEAARRCDSWSHLPGIYAEGETCFELRGEPRPDAKLALDLDEWKVLFLVANRCRLREIWKRSLLGSRFETSRTLFGLASARLIQPTGGLSEDFASGAAGASGQADPTAPPPPVMPNSSETSVVVRTTAQGDPEADTQPVVTRSDKDSPQADGVAVPRAPRTPRLTRSQIRVKKTPCLVQLANQEKAQVFELAGESVRLGRSADNNLILPDGHVSGHHARILREGERFEIEDTQSSNGIRVDGVAVLRSPLDGGEVIEIYPYRFRFEVAFDVSESK